MTRIGALLLLGAILIYSWVWIVNSEHIGLDIAHVYVEEEL